LHLDINNLTTSQPTIVDAEQIDIVFCALPYRDIDHVYSAPALLRGLVESEGFRADTVDFGLLLLDLCGQDLDLFTKVQTYFITAPGSEFAYYALVEQFYARIIDWLKQHPSKFISLSVFSVYTHKCALELAAHIRNANISSKILLGGRGTKVQLFIAVNSLFSPRGRERLMSFGEFAASRNLCDHYIIGDGERDLLTIMGKEDFNNRQNDSATTFDVFKYPSPNYDSYELVDYPWPKGERYLPITGSKGCVRNCDFCDIEFQFGRYAYRTGQDIFNEMVHLSQRYGIKKFVFTDSLVNGGLKQFEVWLTMLAEYNDNACAADKITWTGQYICRLSDQMPQHLYALIKRSGGQGLTIGVESGSNRVLEAMNKKTSVEALFDELDQFRSHGIDCFLLTFVGHWSEHWEDFIQHCKMLINLVPYVKSGTVASIELGVHPFLVLEGTQASRNSDLVLQGGHDSEDVWYCKSNPDLTFKDRIYRMLTVHQLGDRLRLPTPGYYHSAVYHNTRIEQDWQCINDFYRQWLPDSGQSTSQRAYENFEYFLHQLLYKDQGEIEVVFESTPGTTDPEMEIHHNGELLESGLFKIGTHTIQANFPYHPTSNKISISLTNKTQQDTRLDSDGNFVYDKSIKLHSLKIDGIDITKQYNVFYHRLQYRSLQGETVPTVMGFWQNATLTIDFGYSFTLWLCENSIDNVQEDYKHRSGTSLAQDDALKTLIANLDKLYR
jgi:hypothetical protein